MTITFACPHCGKQLGAPEALAGQARRCPQCRSNVVVPSEPEPAPAAAPAVAAPREPTEGVAPAAYEPLDLGPNRGHPEDLIDMTAMVDIVFFILIFFMVTSLQALEAVIGLPSPEAQSANAIQPAPRADDPGFVTVTIEGDDTVWLEDEEVFGEQDLRIKLRQLRKDDPDLSGLMVVGNPEASHGALVMVLDAGADAGMGEIRFSVSEQPDF
jgi:biopolymer transport protein ExbD